MTSSAGNSCKQLAGRSAVVTGSSSGIGRAIALTLARAGADVLVHARGNASGGQEVVHAVAELGANASLVLADLSEHRGQDQLLQAAQDWRPVDIWINNAGADVLTGDAAEWSFERKLQQLWAVDVMATIRLARAAGMDMQRRGQGVILNIGWDQADDGMAGDAGQLFGTTKSAVTAFTRSLASSLAPRVRVNCLAPGWIRTAWGKSASEYWQQRARQESLLGRWGEPADVAEVALFLVSDAAAFVNGQVVCINGGRP